MAQPLYQSHGRGLAATYADVENQALSMGPLLSGTPGSIALRTNATGAAYYVRQYYDHDKVKRAEYIVARDSPEAEEKLREWRARIDDTQSIIESVRLLAREGYSALPPRHFAALVPLCNFGLFRAGAVLVGTHAFEVIVNRLGIRSAAFTTEDVDVARPARLALGKVPEGGLLGLLRESGIDFVEVPPLDPRQPSTHFKQRGRSSFTFDLLVPAPGTEPSVEEVPELETHATALPYLRYLIADTQPGAVMSNHGVAMVRVPLAERFALHKLLVSRLRKGRPAKSEKDLRQAAVLIAALGELMPGAIAAAFGKTPTSARSHMGKSLTAIAPWLEPHPQAWEEVSGFAKA